jgi:glycosyltransferase involved in cell wall biosynthesis
MKRINIVAWHNGGGLSKDIDILCGALRDSDYEISLNGAVLAEAPVRRQRIVHRAANVAHRWLHHAAMAASPYDVNVFLEDISPGFFQYARVNAFIPNPEWFKNYQQRYLAGIDVVLCKTRSAQDTFQALGSQTRFISFTSEDRRSALHEHHREDTFLHVAGRSWQKGTRALFDAWLRHPEWPLLTVVQSARTYSQSRVRAVAAPNIRHRLERLDDATLKALQNTIAHHLCPSEAEGFGHCINEAMSCGAVTLTTNAPPMNELITPERGILVGYHRAKAQRAGMNYFVDPVDLERQIAAIIGMDPTAKQRLGKRARAWFEENDRLFRTRLVTALDEALLAPR